MSKIKICGLKSEEDIDYVNLFLPDFVGFILSDGFRRSISVEKAKKLKSLLNPKIKAVGVFVDDDADKINNIYENNIIDLVQLHGKESPDFCKKIKAPVIKAFIVDNNTSEKIKKYEDVCDFLLFDSGRGSGAEIDFSSVPICNKPYFLAGGINLQNIEIAKKMLSPFCFDVSSSVETNGKKDKAKIEQIIRRTHE